MFELSTDIETAGLQSVAEVAALHRRRHRRGSRSYRSNTCLITGNNSLNGVSVLNILNGFGGGGW